MQRLVECLQSVEATPSLENEPEVQLDTVDHPLIDEIIFLATHLFVDEKGTPAFECIDQFHLEHGYFIYPGERDRFGWVTACLQTKKGFIVFG